MRALVLPALLLLATVPVVEAQEVRQFRPQPIPGLALTPEGNTTIEIPQGETRVFGVTARNNGSETLRLNVGVMSGSRPDAPQHLAVNATPSALELAPGAEARIDVTLAMAADTPNGTQRRVMLMVTRQGGGEGMQDVALTVRAPGECVPKCEESESGGFFFSSGPAPGMAGPGVIRQDRPIGDVVRPDPNATRNASARAMEESYDETPGPGALLALGALGLVALALRREE